MERIKVKGTCWDGADEYGLGSREGWTVEVRRLGVASGRARGGVTDRLKRKLRVPGVDGMLI